MKITKILSLIFAIILCLSLLSSCGETDVPDGYYSVSPEASSFNLYVPKSWYDNSASGTASAYYSSSDKSNVSMVAMIADADYDTLEDYLVFADANLAIALNGYELVISSAVDSSAVDSSATDSSAVKSSAIELASRDTKLAGLNAKEFEYKASLNGLTYRFKQIVALRSTTFYVLTYTAQDSVYESHLDEVNEIASYVTFK